MQGNTQHMLVSDDLFSVMKRLAGPAILAMMLFGANAFMDTIFVGQMLGQAQMAGLSLAYPITAILLGLGAWLGSGAGNLLSIALGQQDQETLGKLLPQLNCLIPLCSALFALPAFFYTDSIISLMGGSGDILQYGSQYLAITLLGAPLWVYSLSLNFVVRAEGRMGEAAKLMTGGLLVNILLTPVLISLGWGVSGAAWSTNIGMLVYCIFSYRYFRHNKASFQSNINRLCWDTKLLGNILKSGLPQFIMTFMTVIQAMVIFNALARHGSQADLAFFAAANRMQLFLMMPLVGLMRALQPVVGVNYGAGLHTRVKQAFKLHTQAGTLLIFPIWLLLVVFPSESLSVMLPDTQFSAQQLWWFQVYMSTLLLLPLVLMAMVYFPAIEQANVASQVGIARQLLFFIPTMWFLPALIGIGGIYYGSFGIDLICTLWLVFMLKRTFVQTSPATVTAHNM